MEKKARCEKCESTNTYIRIKTGEIVCRKCGMVTPVKAEGTVRLNE